VSSSMVLVRKLKPESCIMSDRPDGLTADELSAFDVLLRCFEGTGPQSWDLGAYNHFDEQDRVRREFERERERQGCSTSGITRFVGKADTAVGLGLLSDETTLSRLIEIRRGLGF
jgi:hypothetical protein